MITEQAFNALAAEGHNRIPLVAQALADLDTPLSLYLKLTKGQPLSFLLESVEGGERFGRYSFVGLPAHTLIRATGRCVEVVTDGVVVETFDGNPLDFIAEYQRRFKVAVPKGLPRFCGGLAGYFGYDTVRHIEHRLAQTHKPGGIGTPDILLLQCEELAVIDNLADRLFLIVYADPAQPGAYAKAASRMAQLQAQLHDVVSAPPIGATTAHEVVRHFAKADFESAVLKAKAYIAAGDCMQVVVGQRLQKRFTAHPLSLYRALRSLNPSPYMYYYDLGDHHVVGSSPEILVRHERGAQGETVTIRPIAGTRPRGATPEQDVANEAELLADPKERAEHVMLIDLARNDIGRIAKTGTVKVTEAFGVERYSHVMHIVSNVEGTLKDGMTGLDVLRASFPAGTLSGAPKIRAMEIIDELEPVQRGVYGGAVGYLSFAGDMDVAIAIRTGVIKDQILYVQAGAGVVADSVPDLEWQETEAKARAVIRASEMVEQGL
ncbi:MAG: anthranilate synthase component I [Aquabacterium sp.]|nr:anthranilate synthase component I [Aquabacterium sp.]